MKWMRVLMVGLLAVALGACAGYNVEQAPKQTVGALAGAGLGALAGSQIGGGRGQLAAVAVGTVLGGLAGSEIGRSLDRADQIAAAQATTRALEYNPSGTPTAWRNPDSGNYGTVTPTRTYEAAGTNCREYEHTVYIEGRAETLTGTACRQADGSWRTAA